MDEKQKGLKMIPGYRAIPDCSADPFYCEAIELKLETRLQTVTGWILFLF